MSIYLLADSSMRELAPNEVCTEINDRDFYRIEEMGIGSFEVSGNKIKNQIKGLLRLEKVVITPIN